MESDERYDQKIADADGFVDLVIDENNPNNYFIDFEINRLTGNLTSDYYQETNSKVDQSVMTDNNSQNSESVYNRF